MKLWSDSLKEGELFPSSFVLGVPNPQTHVTFADNRNPHLAWSNAPDNTLSFAIICHDPDVPSVGDDVNQEGRSVPADLPRVDFFHWVLIDIPVQTTSIVDAEFSSCFVPHGKTGPEAHNGTRQGVNDYTGWFAGDSDMAGNYFGYDGPCPPWNDSIWHRYIFTIYALDIPKLNVEGVFTGQQVRDAMQGHILAEASFTSIYSLTPELLESKA